MPERGVNSFKLPPMRVVCKWLFDNFLLVGLLFFVIFGALVPAPGKVFASSPVTQPICLMTIFVLTGVKLPTDEVRQALSAR